jgi:DNA segregation ATPase FtsK/SpoIIIE, S-DNA-T family
MGKNQIQPQTQPKIERKTPPSSSNGPKGQLKIPIDKIKSDPRNTKLLGGTLMVLAVCLAIAFVSYIFTGAADQSVAEHRSPFDTKLNTSAEDAQNKLGHFGSIIAHFFIFRWFGIGALAFPLLLFLYGYQIAFGRELLPLKRTSQIVVFYTIWAALFFGYFIVTFKWVQDFSILSGGFGHALNALLIPKIGLGMLILILGMLIIFMMYFHNITSIDQIFNFDSILRIFENRRNVESPDLEVVSEDNDDDDEEIVSEEENEPVKPVVKELPLVSKPKPTKLADISFTIEATAEDELVDEEPESTGPIPSSTNDPLPPIIPFNLGEDEEDLIAKFGPFDPTLDLANYQYPTIDLLHKRDESGTNKVTTEELEANKDRIVETLGNFGIGIASIKATIGPTVTLYEIVPDAGIRISKIKGLEDDIALNLAALGIRIIAPMPGKGTIGIELPNKNREMVTARSVLGSKKFQDCNFDLPVVLGKTISNEIFITDLAKMPHLLMAGATGQGKSVGLNVLLASLLYKKHPAHIKFVLVDPKKVELTLFNKIERHFLAKLPNSEEAIITDTRKVVYTLNSLCIEMDSRYDLLKEAGVRNIKEYNVKFTQRQLNPNKGHKFLPYIILVIDELADLMMTAGKEVEQPIARLAQLARAIGIHLVVATQRPSVNVITGLIKANFPARLSFRVTSKIDSRTILDTGGAEQLVGMGDMLLSMGSDMIRLQCAFLDTDEVDDVCEFIGNQRGYSSAYYLPEFSGDEDSGDKEDVDLGDRDVLFDDAARVIVNAQQGSTSLIQRKMKLGYNRAGRIMDQLEAAGVVGPFEGSKAREVFITDLNALEQLLKNLG